MVDIHDAFMVYECFDETQLQYLRDVIEYIQSLEIIMTVRDALNERANIVDIGRY